MKYRLDNVDWRTWGVEHLIREDILARIATCWLYVSYIHKRARTEVEIVRYHHEFLHQKAFHPITYKELQEKSLEEALARLDPDPAMDNPFDMGTILKHAFIITMLEEYLQEQRNLGIELKRPSEESNAGRRCRNGSSHSREVVEHDQEL
jgi:hypothetical protein